MDGEVVVLGGYQRRSRQPKEMHMVRHGAAHPAVRWAPPYLHHGPYSAEDEVVQDWAAIVGQRVA